MYSFPRKCLLYAFLIALSAPILAGCTSEKSPDESPDEEYDGKEMFRGLVLGQGEVADEISVIRDHFKVDNYIHSDVERRGLTNFHNQLLDHIEEENPEYFASFKQDITSGDHSHIQNTLNEASLVAVESMTRLEEVEAFRQRLRENRALADSIIHKAQTQNVEDRTIEQVERTLEALASGELESIRRDGLPNVGTAWLVEPLMHSGIAVVVPVEVAAAVCTWVEVTFTDDNGNGDEIPLPRYSAEEAQLLQEQAIDAIATQFGT